MKGNNDTQPTYYCPVCHAHGLMTSCCGQATTPNRGRS